MQWCCCGEKLVLPLYLLMLLLFATVAAIFFKLNFALYKLFVLACPVIDLLALCAGEFYELFLSHMFYLVVSGIYPISLCAST